MYVVGFESFVLKTVISPEFCFFSVLFFFFFFFFKQTHWALLFCFYLPEKGNIPHFDLGWPSSLQLYVCCSWVLMFNGSRVQQSDIGPEIWSFKSLSCEKKEKKINQVINLNFIWLLFFLFLPGGMIQKQWRLHGASVNFSCHLPLYHTTLHWSVTCQAVVGERQRTFWNN